MLILIWEAATSKDTNMCIPHVRDTIALKNDICDMQNDCH